MIFCSAFFPIFVAGFDLSFSEFGIISSNDFLGMSSCYVEFHLDQLWELFVLFWLGFLQFLGASPSCSLRRASVWISFLATGGYWDEWVGAVLLGWGSVFRFVLASVNQCWPVLVTVCSPTACSSLQHWFGGEQPLYPRFSCCLEFSAWQIWFVRALRDYDPFWVP
jgi:hypothetical protein